MKEEEKIAVCSKFPSKLCRENIGMGVRQTVSKHKQNTFYPKLGQHRTTNISTEDEDMSRKFKVAKIILLSLSTGKQGWQHKNSLGVCLK